MAMQSRLELTIERGKAMEEELQIANCVVADPSFYVAALNSGLGPGDQSLGEWVANTIRDARRQVATNSALGDAQEQGSDRDQGAAGNAQQAAGERQ